VAKVGTTISLAELRARLVGAQGYALRARTGTKQEALDTIRRLACVQLDSISTSSAAIASRSERASARIPSRRWRS
jgi:uncharacterized protein YcaQ